MGGDLDLAPKFKEFLQSRNWLAEYVIDLDKTLQEIWNNYGEWKGFEEFNGIGELLLLLAASDGVHLIADGLSIY